MNKKLIAIVTLVVTLACGQILAQQTAPEQAQPPRPKPLTFAERMKQYLRRTGSAVDDTRSTPDMIVSNYPDPKGGKITVVLVNDRRRNFLGFYIYNFGNLKGSENKEEVYKYLLAANDAITIGSFFVDGEEDIGYKYLVSGGQTLTQSAFESVYYTMAAVARERKAEIRKMLGASKEQKPDVQNTAEEKPPKESSTQDRIRVESEPPAANQESQSKQDPGVDTATIVTALANLRLEPSDSGVVVLKARKDDLMVLLDRTPVGPWYYVIDVGSSKEGWIHGNVIKIAYTNRRTSSSPFEARRLETNGHPRIEISNDSHKDLNLKVGRSLYVITAHSNKTIQVTPGSYKYYGAAAGVIPAVGEQTFESGYAYTWRFLLDGATR